MNGDADREGVAQVDVRQLARGLRMMAMLPVLGARRNSICRSLASHERIQARQHSAPALSRRVGASGATPLHETSTLFGRADELQTRDHAASSSADARALADVGEGPSRGLQPRIDVQRSSLWSATRLEIPMACEHAAGGSWLDSAVSQPSSDIHVSERLNRGHCGR